ncbi:MAG TPA: MOSC and FAD-binding oxidoreductase domain-containing protein [Burkholderiales bacterium]|nr:MOSC and FAD-binding oxidoreductase domain-containing protein [Burkholderiales bacterium]
MPHVISVNVGLPRDIGWRGRTVHTGIWKTSVPGRRMARRLNIDGDGQGDLAGHGGEQRAVLAYQIESYRYWERELGRNDFSFGQFGENLTIEGLADDEVCIGDRYRIGGALFEVTQPRVTCYRVGIRMDEPRMAALLVSHRRPGFYLRVLEAGEIGAGDPIHKVADGPERISVAEIDALLYLPGHRRDRLERSLRIPQLSPGWKVSLRALLDQETTGPGAGNAGLAKPAGPPPAWAGFRPLRVARVDRESAGVASLSFAAADGTPLPAALPGQFVVLRLRPSPELPPVMRTYSLSGAPGAGTYRVSIKQEMHGVASPFLCSRIEVGDCVESSAPRGGFVLGAGHGPVVLLSAGIGATPVLAMLHALVSAASPREIWWLHGARNGNQHAFARESRQLVEALALGRRHITYSRPALQDRPGDDYDEQGHLSVRSLERLGVPRSADFYLCGPAPFLEDFTAGLGAWGVAAARLHTEFFGPEKSLTPGISGHERCPVHPPAGVAGSGPRVSFTRSGIEVRWDPGFQSLLELAEACDVPARWSCRTGVCHTCECILIDGAVTYRPDPLEPAADGNILICCSQPLRDIEIDL